MLERQRDPHVKPEKKHTADKFTFAELGENEEDLVELEARYAKVRRLGSVLRRRSGS